MEDRTLTPTEINLSPEPTPPAPSSPPVPSPPPPPCLLAALTLERLGWSLIPLCNPLHHGKDYESHRKTCTRPGKTPMVRWKQRQQLRFTEGQLTLLWEQRRLMNVGVVTGQISGIIMVDIDDDIGEEEWRRFTRAGTAQTWEFGTGRGGRHLIYRWTEKTPPRGNPFRGLAGHLDFLGEGRQSVIPPSRHFKGEDYRWTKGGPHSGLPIADAPHGLVTAVLTAGRHNRRPGVCAGSGARRGGAEPKQLVRARAYLAKCQPAVSGQGGHAHTFKIANVLIHGFGLQIPAAMRLLLEDWNERCAPPWSEGELQHKLEDAAREGHRPPIIERPRPGASTSVVNSNESGYSRVIANGDGREAKGWTQASKVNKREVTYLMSGWIPAGALTMVDGKKGVGKSSLLAAVAAQTTGGPLLPFSDQIHFPRGEVFWFASEEDICCMTVPRLQAAGADLDHVWFPNHNAEGRKIRDYRVPVDLPSLREEISGRDCKLMIVDPWVSLLAPGLSENSQQDVRAALEPLQDLASETGCAIVMSRHIRKTSVGPAIDQGLGSTAIGNVARAVLLIDRHPSDRGRRVLACTATNYNDTPPSLSFSLPALGGTPRVEWGDLSPFDADQLTAEADDRTPHSTRQTARRLIRDRIGDGWVAVKEVQREAEAAGISLSVLDRAKHDLGVISKRNGGVGAAGQWFWGPPPEGWPDLWT